MKNAMKLERVAPTFGYTAEIRWSRPARYDDIVSRGSPHDSEAWFYMILGYYMTSSPKIFYIGKVFNSCVSRRLRQPDHRARFKELQAKYPRHSFRVSLGALSVSRGASELASGHITAQRIDEIESILIFAAFHSHDTLKNKNKKWKSGWRHPYVIRNLGCKAPLPREVHYAVFIR
jgi:hypothetical protein